jgi:hypothetical protein
MNRVRIALFTSIALLPLGACRNSCQQVCVEMAKYAEDECGLTVPDEQIDACIDAQAGDASRDNRGVCRDYGNPSSIEQEWGCEELADYFDP